MLTSELISLLQKSLTTNGDLEVILSYTDHTDWDYDMSITETVVKDIIIKYNDNEESQTFLSILVKEENDVHPI